MLPRIVIVFPIVMMLVFPFAANMEVRNINLAVVDNDRTDMSSELVEKCTESGYFRLKKICSDPREAQKMMDRNTVDAILTIGEGFGRSMVTGDGFPVGIKVNTVNGTKGSIGSQYLSNCIMLFMQSHSDASAVSADSASGAVIEAAPKYYYNPYMDYKVFMVPALIVIAVTMVTGFFPALNIVGEKEAGTIEQMNVTPVRKSVFILSKLIPSWVIGMLILTLGLFFSWLLYGVTPEGGYLGIYVVSFIFLMAMVGFGVLLSTACRNQQQVMLLCFFFLLIICLLCGMWSPIGSMPVWAHFIADINPLRYYVEAIRLFYAYGSSLGDATRYIWILCVFIAIFNIWAVWNFRKAR